LIKPALIGSHLGWGTIAVPGDEPSSVVVFGKLDERGSELFDGISRITYFEGLVIGLIDGLPAGTSRTL
jgi:hypothetical protein